MTNAENAPQDFVSTFALQRQRLLHHAGAVLDIEGTSQSADVQRLSQTVLTALELLKVAEQELREERRTNATIQAAQDRRLAHLETMFSIAPAALVLTTADTTIRESNAIAARLFGRDAYSLAGRQLSESIVRDEKAKFREQLGLAIEMGGVPECCFTLQVQRSAPVRITATMQVIDDPAVGARALYWYLRPAV